jgi:hypothetical protein
MDYESFEREKFWENEFPTFGVTNEGYCYGLLHFFFDMLMQSHIGHRGSRPITWIYKFKFNLLMGSRATKLVVGVHWFPLRLGILLLWLDLMICHSNYCFQAIVSYWGEALQGKTWLPTKISIYRSIYEIQSISHVFWFSIEDISGSSGSILMQDSVLETLLVTNYTI